MQVYLGDDEWAGEEEDPLGDVMCMECNRGDDESNLMLCDGECMYYGSLLALSIQLCPEGTQANSPA